MVAGSKRRSDSTGDDGGVKRIMQNCTAYPPEDEPDLAAELAAVDGFPQAGEIDGNGFGGNGDDLSSLEPELIAQLLHTIQSQPCNPKSPFQSAWDEFVANEGFHVPEMEEAVLDEADLEELIEHGELEQTSLDGFIPRDGLEETVLSSEDEESRYGEGEEEQQGGAVQGGEKEGEGAGLDAGGKAPNNDHDILEAINRVFGAGFSIDRLESLCRSKADAISPTARAHLDLFLCATRQGSNGWSPPGTSDDQAGTRKQHRQRRRRTTETWWRRFHGVSLAHVALPTALAATIQQPIASVLAPTAMDMDMSHAQNCSGGLGVFAAHVRHMVALEHSNAVNTALSICYHLFFYIASDPDPSAWAHLSVQRRADFVSGKRLAPLSTANEKALVATHASILAELNMPPSELCKIVSKWRRVGSRYAFLAWHWGLGALLHLHHVIPPHVMGNCSKGGEGPSADGMKASDRELSRLRGVMALAEASGAEKFVHAVLWELCGRFEGFERESAGDMFPGFEAPL